MSIGLWLIIFFIVLGTLSYQEASLSVWAVAVAVFLLLMMRLSTVPMCFFLIASVFFISLFGLLYWGPWRRQLIVRFILSFYIKNKPSMSTTEREALEAGTVGWEGELFSGFPDWQKLLSLRKPTLSPEEEAFLNGPVETLCAMIDDWDITQNRADLPEAVWNYLKNEGFFALIIPKKYGGKAFSAFAHSQILTKVYGRSTTVGSTIAVPNSLGPAELILHYGTDEQKNYYLPRLAAGTEVPCFALTGPSAGSDAGAMTDRGIVCRGIHEGQSIIGVRLNWNKRYITLAPIATVIGLAFKLEDPEHLIGNQSYLGITCALVPHDRPGVIIGRRHFPCNIVFQNGPTQGHDVFIPLDWIIGGVDRAGQGWRMLMECLAAGRAISLPASAAGGSKVVAYTAGAYARVRRQFNQPIGRFGGIEEVLSRMMGLAYIVDATRSFTAAIIDQGEKPAVASGITKYHTTELGRAIINDAMDLHGGKGICLGPRNYLGRYYQASPIAITVEGANILTRNMIIFGQGMMRCHPYIFAEYEAASLKNKSERLKAFDQLLMKHLKFIMTNFFRTLFLSVTGACIVRAPKTKFKRYFQQATRFSATLALLTDFSILVLGGALKRKENISARLGDILSYLYLLSAVLKHDEDLGRPVEDGPLVHWACQYCFYQIQQKIDELLLNFPSRIGAYFLRAIIFPFGKHFKAPSDQLNHTVSQLFLAPTATRDRLSQGAFITDVPNNMLAVVQNALLKVMEAAPVEKILKESLKAHMIKGDTILEQAHEAYHLQVITAEDLQKITVAETARSELIAVDDFSPQELAHQKS